MKTTHEPAAGGKKSLSFSTRYCGRAYVVTDFYQHGSTLAVELEDAIGEPIATLSVNIPERAHLLGEGEFFAKTWSENEGIAEDALASGIFRNTGRASGDNLNAPIWEFK